jgi:Ca2+-binding RTX toxin-like protein
LFIKALTPWHLANIIYLAVVLMSMFVISMRKGKLGLQAVMIVAATSLAILFIPTFVSAEVTKGTDEAESFSGTSGDDKINARGGDDFITDPEGDDKYKGGDGDDVIEDTSGEDKFKCGTGVDTIFPDGDDDKIHKDCERIER